MTETETPAPTARELVECPFCESDDLTVDGGDDRASWVTCENCGCEGPFHRTEAEALRLWNARAEAATLRAEVARLKAALESLVSAADKHRRNFGISPGASEALNVAREALKGGA